MNETKKHIKQICTQIEVSVNRKINSYQDTIWLSDLFKDKKILISASTFARIFSITNSKTKPYKATLDNLAKFLDYKDWENYINYQSKYHSHSNIFLNEDANGFSKINLEIALLVKNYEAVKLELDKYEKFITSNSIHFDVANLIGRYVKINNYDNELLIILAKSAAGRRLFYGCFVDENNENDYFSKAIYNYYLPQVPDFENTLFVTCFILAQKIYFGTIDYPILNRYQNLIKDIDIENLHYHLISRYFECNILIDGTNKILHKNVENYLNLISHFAFIKQKNEWLLARSIKALLHFGFKKELINHKKINEAIITSLMKKRKSNNSAALYIIQLYYLYCNYNLNNGAYHPFYLSNEYLQGNSTEKIAIESATTYVFAKGKNQKLIKQNLQEYCKLNKINWILNLVFKE
jgi:hypothetical protein